MITKCYTIDDAVGVFGDATLETPGLPIHLQQLILFTTLNNIKKRLAPEYVEDFILEIENYMEFEPDLKNVLTNYRNIFNDDFNIEEYLGRMSKLDGEETDQSKVDARTSTRSEFLRKKFKDSNSKSIAGAAMLYFLRDARLKLMSTFLINREKGKLVAENEILQNVKELKLQLLDTVVDYLKSRGFRDEQLGNTQLYDEAGVYLEILDPNSSLTLAIFLKLELGLAFDTRKIKDAYENFRAKKGNWQEDQKFIEAYNAKLLLEDFDKLTVMFLGSIIQPGNNNYNDLRNETYNTKIDRATNMWGNGLGDEVENIADLVSDVTQQLIQTSKKYTWKGGPMEDLYLSFLDFNYIITKVKKLALHPKSKKRVLDKTFFETTNKGAIISSETKRTLQTIKNLKIQLGYTKGLEEPTFEDVLSFISDNPLRHLHAVFDLLCNTNLVNFFGTELGTNDKNLIWTVGKELFGTWPTTTDPEGNTIYSRSLFDLHRNSNNDRIFEIVTLITDSMFADLFLQYYEDTEGTLKMRYLLDYSVSQEKNLLMYAMRQTNGNISGERFKLFIEDHNIDIIEKKERKLYPGKKENLAILVNNPNYDPTVKGSNSNRYARVKFIDSIEIPLNSIITLVYKDGKLFDKNSKNTAKTLKESGDPNNYMGEIWKSDKFRSFIKGAIGIDFKTNVELASAYEEGFKIVTLDGASYTDYKALIFNISAICAAATYNLAFNNRVISSALDLGVKKYKNEIELLRNIQYEGHDSKPRINIETGVAEMLSDKQRDSYLEKLALAHATVHGLLTSALVKTGEGTALASQCLSCLRSSHHYQIMTLNRNKKSSTKHMSYVNNENGLYLGVNGVREFKSDATTKVNTDMSAAESFTGSFIGGFVGAFTDSTDTSTINRQGKIFVVPAVYSDKTKLDTIAVDLHATSPRIKNPDGSPKRYKDMTDLELESEMKYEFGQMYSSIINNVNEENLKFALVLGLNTDALQFEAHPVEIYRNALTEISMKLCDNTDLLNLAEDNGGKLAQEIRNLKEAGKTSTEIVESLLQNDSYRKELGGIRKKRIIKQMHDMMTSYNKIHRRKPIEMCEHIHYLFSKDGMLVPNDTLIALWGRFAGNQLLNNSLGIASLYPAGHENASTAEGYFKYEKDLRMVQELLTDGVEIFLMGKLSKEKLEELKWLRKTFPDWVTKSGKMSFAKIFNLATLTWEDVIDPKVVELYANNPELRDLIKVHPMLSKLNRITYLTALLYTSCVGGAHYVYKGGGKDILEEEASRWLASNKRNVCYASTVHKYQNKTLNGVPKFYQIAPIEDFSSIVYSIMGDLDSHKPLDGGMIVNPWFPILENNSLGGEAAGLDKKQFGTYYYERYAAGGIIKTAGFAITNQRQRRSKAYRNLCKNCTDRTWIKEFTTADGTDIPEYLDITRDYKGEVLNWILDANGLGTYYLRPTRGTKGCGRFKLAKVEAIYSNGINEVIPTLENLLEYLIAGYKPTNRYKIYEFPVKANGEIDETYPEIAEQIPDLNDNSPEAQILREMPLEPILRTLGADENGEFLIDTNWKMYNLLFGGALSLSLNEAGYLKPSENSIYQMVHALNNIGYTRTIENNDEAFGDERYDTEFIDKVLDLDDLWQPLKYSDISYAPNIGALKSTQMNVNPKEGMYEEKYLNAMNIVMAQLGIQLDKEHHADDSEVSMPTLIILACANKGYTIHYTDKLYKALSTLTEIAISDCMDGIMEIMPGNTNTGKLLTEVSKIIVDKLIHSLDDNAAIEAVMDTLILKAKAGHRITAEDVIGKVAWSDPALYNKIYSSLASHLTNSAIKMKFPGTLAVICPTEKLELMHGDRRLDSYSDPDNDISEEEALAMHQEAIRRGQFPDLLIYDIDGNFNTTVQEKLNLASKLETQHNYYVEWCYIGEDGKMPNISDEKNIFKESITIDTPNKYYLLKEWIALGAREEEGEIEFNGYKVPRNQMKVIRVYENIELGRELGAYNARFESLEKGRNGIAKKFCIFDLDSIKTLFDYADLDLTFENAKDLLMEEKFIWPQRDYALDLVARYLLKKYPDIGKKLKETVELDTGEDLTKLAENLGEDAQKAFTEAAFKVCRVLTYKALELDLFKISKDYDGERKVYANGELITVNPKTITTKAYELIMPKVYQTRFGLEELDLVQEILADKEFFTKRAVQKLKNLHVSESCFHYELKNFNGKHVYIYDLKLGTPDPEIFYPCKKAGEPYEVEPGVWERRNIDGEYIHGLSSDKDKIMLIGSLGYEVIVTDNPEYYLENMKYNLATFSNETVNEETLLTLVNNLKETKSKNAQKFIRSISNKKGKIRDFKSLQERNNAISNLSLEDAINLSLEILELILQFRQEGKELHSSFSKSLDIIAGRIPALSLLSFMPQRVVAFDDNDINTAYVSTFLLFLLGSDLDIDAVTLLGSEFDENGKYVIWSPLADITTEENLEASLTLPFPTGKETSIEITNSKDSFFKVYNDYIRDLFDWDYDIDDSGNRIPAKNDQGFYILKLKDLNPEKIELLALFLDDVNDSGFSIKGSTKSDDSWKPSDELIEEWEGKRYLDEEHYLEYPFALKLLGFTTVEAAYNALLQIKEIVDSHNLYIHNVGKRTREKMTKNLCQWAMYQICSTPSNLIELMVGVDLSTAPIKADEKEAKEKGIEIGAVAQSPYNGDDKKAAPGNYNTLHRSFQEGLIGKLCVGIGAVSIKVNSTTQYYMDYILRNGSERDKLRLLFPIVNNWGERVDLSSASEEAINKALLEGKIHRGYLLGGQLRKGLSNLYDKNSEKGIVLKNLEIIELLDSIKTEDDITPNVAMSLAAMLSVAVDNAKDLALAKINAGPKIFGFYAYGISLGMDIRDLAKIINTPQGRAIAKLCEGNVFNGLMGAADALSAIKKLEGENLYNDLHLFDILAKLLVHSKENAELVEERNSGVLINNESMSTASKVVQQLFIDYYEKFIHPNQNLLQGKPNVKRPRNKKLKFDTNLDALLYNISIAGKIDECIAYITNPMLNPIWNLIINGIDGVKDLSNSEEWLASIHQLLEHCSKYGNLVDTYYSRESKFSKNYPARDLKILAQGAREMQILGLILSSNKGVKSKILEGTTFIKNIEEAVINRKEIMGLTPFEDDRIDFTLFCVDAHYRQEAIDKYEEVKHSVNILDVISTAPHFLSYLRSCAIPYAAFKMGSAKFRARDRYYDTVVKGLKERGTLTRLDKENVLRGIESAANFDMFLKWLHSNNLRFWLPAGSKIFVGRNQEMDTLSSDLYILLWDENGNGLATFKYYMEQTIIPNLRSNGDYSHNSFVNGLAPFELTKTGTHAAVQAMTLDGNMMPFTESLTVQLELYKADFSSMYSFNFPGANTSLFNTLNSYADAFYIYSLYVFGGRKSLRSLMTMFDDNTLDLAKSFLEFEADMDANGDIELELEDLIKWCAPVSNMYKPSADYFYAVPKDLFGKLLFLKVKPSKDSSDPEEGLGEEPSKNKGKQIILIGDSSTEAGRLFYTNPTMHELAMGENTYKKGKNINILRYDNLLNITIDPENLEESFALVANEYSGEYSVLPNGVLSPRSQEILKLVESNLELAYINVYNGSGELPSRGIDTDVLDAIIVEAINTIDENC